MSEQPDEKKESSFEHSPAEAGARSEGTERGTPASCTGVLPPYSNRGVYPTAGSHIDVGMLTGVDAYNCTVFTNPDALYADLERLLVSAGFDSRREIGPPIRFYARNLLLIGPTGHRLLQVRAGGSNPHPFIEVKGDVAPLVAQYLRANYNHRPSRIDHSVDRGAPQLFNRLRRALAATAKNHRLKFEPRGDWVSPDGGRTIYVGSRRSQVFLRVYEKGIKYARNLGLELTEELREWVRIEIEFKPQTPLARSLACTITPAQIWGSTLWTREFADNVLSLKSEIVQIRERRESNRDRALRFMTMQYRAHLMSLLMHCNSDLEAFGLELALLAQISPCAEHPAGQSGA